MTIIPDHIQLMGAEAVGRAGHQMESAAADMQRAAAQVDDSLHRQRLFLEDWLSQFEKILTAGRDGGGR